MSTTVPRGFRFEQTIPYDTPSRSTNSKDQQQDRPGAPHINTSPNPVYDLAEPSQQWSLYSAVVRDGLPSEQTAILNRGMLCALWPDLNLPARCRAIWEDKSRTRGAIAFEGLVGAALPSETGRARTGRDL